MLLRLTRLVAVACLTLLGVAYIITFEEDDSFYISAAMRAYNTLRNDFYISAAMLAYNSVWKDA